MNLHKKEDQNLPRNSSSSEPANQEQVNPGRIIDLGIQILEHFVSLIVRFSPEPEGKVNILLQIRPGKRQTYLPPGLQMVVIDDTDAVFLEAESSRSDNWIQLEFQGLPGKRFAVKVALGEASLTESFFI